MGLFNKIFGKKRDISSNDLMGSIILELDKMQQRTLQIGMVLSDEKQVELQNKIEEFREFIKNNTVNDEEVERSFNNLKAEFELQLKELGQIYLFKALENLSKKLDKRCFGDETKENEQEENLSFLESKYNSLLGRVDEFNRSKKRTICKRINKNKI